MKRIIIVLSLMALALSSCEKKKVGINTFTSINDPAISIRLSAIANNTEEVNVDLTINYFGQFDSAFVSLDNKRIATVTGFPYHSDTTFSIQDGIHEYEYTGDVYVNEKKVQCTGILTTTLIYE